MKKRLLLAAVVAVGYLIVTNTPTMAISSEDECADVDVVFARGSGQQLNPDESKRLKGQLDERFKSGTLYHYYELGSETYDGAKYPAVDVKLFDGNLIGAVVSYGHANDYGKSVVAGKVELQGYLKARSERCPNERIVLAGYSQGAQVIGEESPELTEYSSRIDFMALIGDPKLHLPEGEGFNPPACNGEGLSPYRRAVTNCNTDNGSLGARKPYLIPAFMNKTGLWCNDKDVVCGTSKNPFDTANHMTYWHEGGAIDNAVREASMRVKESLTPDKAANVDVRIFQPGTGTTGLDVVFVIDTTSSMRERLARAKEFARTSAEKIQALHGRVALVAYRDAGDEEYAAKLVSGFGDDLTDFQEKLDSLEAQGGGDNPEGLLHALNVGFDGLAWKAGATKAAVVLTDDSYHNPDGTDGATNESIAKRALEIDPVNIYAVVPENIEPNYTMLTGLTSGQTIRDTGDTEAALTAALTKIKDRPTALLKLSEYATEPGGTVHFDASDSYVIDAEITKYEWDFDGNVSFDQTTTIPAVDHTYATRFEGYMQVRMTATNDTVASASAVVKIGTKKQATLPPPPANLKLEVLETKAGQSRVRLSWELPFGNRADFWQLHMNDMLIGRMIFDRTSVEITEVPRDKDITFSLRGLLDDYTPGQPATVMLGKEVVPPTQDSKSWLDKLLSCLKQLLDIWHIKLPWRHNF